MLISPFPTGESLGLQDSYQTRGLQDTLEVRLRCLTGGGSWEMGIYSNQSALRDLLMLKLVMIAVHF